MSSASLATVSVPEGATWTPLVAPVGVDSIVVFQQFRTDREFDFVTDTTLPTGDVPAYTARPDMNRDWISWNLDAGHGIWCRHYSQGAILFTVGVEDA